MIPSAPDKRTLTDGLAAYPGDVPFIAKSKEIEKLTLKPGDSLHPSRYCFAEALSARNYERELKGQPFPDGTAPMVIVSGPNPKNRNRLLAGLIRLHHGVALTPGPTISQGDAATNKILREAVGAKAPFIWIQAESFHAMNLAIFAARLSPIRIYCSYPHAGRPSAAASVMRMSRMIQLSA